MKLLLFILLAGCSAPVSPLSPKFKVGDCIDSIRSKNYEFIKPEPHIRKILKVGNKNYYYSYYTEEYEESFYMIDTFSVKVDCPTE